MAEAAESVARRLEISVIIEGTPPEKELRGIGTVSASRALDELGRNYDYSWSVSTTGVVLFRKSFSDEYSRPEIVDAEMQSALKKILAAMSPFYVRRPNDQRPVLLFKQIEAGLPPDGRRLMGENGLPISTLRGRLQADSLHAVYNHALGPIHGRCARLAAVLSDLPEATIQAPPRANNWSPILQVRYLRPTSEYTQAAIGLWTVPRVQNENPVSPKGNVPLNKAAPERSTTNYVTALTVRASIAVLQPLIERQIDVDSDLSDRRLVMIAPKRLAHQVLTALAELHGWTCLSTTVNRVPVLRNGRRPTRRVQVFSDVGPAILEALPADVQRSLTTGPTTLNGKPSAPFRDPFAPPGSVGKVVDSVYSKLKRQTAICQQEFMESFPGFDFSIPTAVKDLTEKQRASLVYFLFADSMAKMIDDIDKAIEGKRGFALDPLNSRLIRQGDSYGVAGAKGGYFLVSETPPVPKFP